MQTPTPAPEISATTLRWFRWIVRRKLRKSFHAVRMLGEAPSVAPGKPFLVFMNHASWWDPMVALFLAERLFPSLDHYGPIDAEALERYKILRKVGLFGVQQDSRRGAAEFLRTSQAILNQSDTALWLTPQGEFSDVRRRPIRFKPGLAHLLSRCGEAMAVPLAVEYTHWQESTPELLLSFGKPVEIPGAADPDALNGKLEVALEQTQDLLSEVAQSQDPSRFENLMEGAAGVRGIYDLWRRARARIEGRPFETEHAPARG